jgi:hypothetical protein
LLPFAGLSANAAVAGFVTDDFNGYATLDYSFEVVGGNPGDQVPLLIFSNLFTSIGGDAYAFSEIIVSTLGSVTTCQSYGGTCPPDAPSDFSGSFGVTVSSGALEDVHLEIEASTNPVLGAATSSASADPLIEIDPAFANAADYSILLSPGVGNATASTPEPGTLILVCCAPLLLLARRCLNWLHKTLPIVYDQLRRIAWKHLSRKRTGHTLQPTALVNEAYLRMFGNPPPEFPAARI